MRRCNTSFVNKKTRSVEITKGGRTTRKFRCPTKKEKTTKAVDSQIRQGTRQKVIGRESLGSTIIVKTTMQQNEKFINPSKVIGESLLAKE